MSDNSKNLEALSIFNVNGKNTGATKIVTTENGTRNFYVTSVLIESTSANTAVTPATLSVGTNASAYTNIVPATLAGGLLTSGIYFALPLNSSTSIIPPNTDIFMNISVGAVATSQTLAAHVIGFYS